MSKEEFYKSIIEICDTYKMYPEMIIKFKSNIINGSGDIQEGERIREMLDGCFRKLDDMYELIVSDEMTDMSEADKAISIETLMFIKSIIKMGTGNLDKIIDLASKVIEMK